jgi:uncharacterized repeat protein (TIGR03943 family)
VTSGRASSLLLAALGATAVFLVATGAALNYVRPSLQPFVLAGGVAMLGLGVLPPFGLLGRERTAGAPDGHGHVEARVGWLLLAPVLVLVLVPPAALGSYAASSRAAVPGGGHGVYPPLTAPVRGAVPMSMAEFVTRALRDRDRSLEGVRVRLVGFATPADGGGYELTRFVIFCCAADAGALQVDVRGDQVQRRPDQWLEVEGTWVPRPVAPFDDLDPATPAIVAAAVRTVTQPRPPYEYTVSYTG